jgi:DnaJ-domain-containing protein 1
MEMIRHRPQPLTTCWEDDHNTRVYRIVLLGLAAAGENAELRDAVYYQYPAVCQAHVLHYSADVESRQILEARLLTRETFAEIAARLATQPATVEYYERIFFSVRDRFEQRDWIRKVIRGPAIADGIESARSSSALRGYVLRFFAYHGGALALDAMINGMATTTVPQQPKDLEGWFSDVFGQVVRTTAAAAASTLDMNQKNMMQTVKLALRARAASAKKGKASSSGPSEETLENILAIVTRSIAGRELPEDSEGGAEITNVRH